MTKENILKKIPDPQVLKKKAEEALRLAKSLYIRRRVKYDNLFNSIKKFKEAVGLMQGLDPKPDIYGDAVTGLEKAKKTLDKEFRDGWFGVEQAIKLGEWERAANEAEVLMEMIPDRKDKRYRDAESKYKQLKRFLSGRRR